MNNNYHVNDVLTASGVFVKEKFKIVWPLFSFKNYFISLGINKSFLINHILNIDSFANTKSWIAEYFLYHLKIDGNNVKLLQKSGVVAIFILSTIHINWFKYFAYKFREKYIQLFSLILCLCYLYYSYQSYFYLITTKAFILELMYLLSTKLKVVKKVSAHNVTNIILFILFSPTIFLNLGFWFSYILTECIFLFWNKFKNTHFIFKFIYMQVLIFLTSQLLLSEFAKETYVFNWFWMILFFSLWKFITLFLIIFNILHIHILDKILIQFITFILKIILKWNICVSFSMIIKIFMATALVYLFIGSYKYDNINNKLFV